MLHGAFRCQYPHNRCAIIGSMHAFFVERLYTQFLLLYFLRLGIRTCPALQVGVFSGWFSCSLTRSFI